jgi:hypothetical protein
MTYVYQDKHLCLNCARLLVQHTAPPVSASMEADTVEGTGAGAYESPKEELSSIRKAEMGQQLLDELRSRNFENAHKLIPLSLKIITSREL